MSREKLVRVCVFLAWFMLPCQSGAQKNRKPVLNDNIPLPVDFALDYQLGLTERKKIRGSSPLLEGTPYNEAGSAVFAKLVGSPSVATLGLPYGWKFTIVNDGSVNA